MLLENDSKTQGLDNINDLRKKQVFGCDRSVVKKDCRSGS